MLTRRIATYLLTFLFAFALVSSAFYLVQVKGRGASVTRESLPAKVRWWRAHRADYDVLFLGDSRTYTNVHPELLDPVLGTHSLNLSTFANWFPTQLAMVRDVVHDIPPGTTVVWSVGQSNFLQKIGLAVTTAYPIPLRETFRYAALGFDPWRLALNVGTYLPITSLVPHAHSIRRVILEQADRPLLRVTTLAEAKSSAPERILRMVALQDEYAHKPGTGRARIDVSGGEIISVTQYMNGGGYYRTELAPAFFRAKQDEYLNGELGGTLDDAAARTAPLPPPEPALVTLFEDILDEFARAGVRVVVVEMQEAPFTYRNPLMHPRFRELMDGLARPRVERRGFAYVVPDFSGIESADFFDYDHLNSRGVEKFSAALGPLLAPHVGSETRNANADAVQLR
jgi:hypothetical protein